MPLRDADGHTSGPSRSERVDAAFWRPPPDGSHPFFRTCVRRPRCAPVDLPPQFKGHLLRLPTLASAVPPRGRLRCHWLRHKTAPKPCDWSRGPPPPPWLSTLRLSSARRRTRSTARSTTRLAPADTVIGVPASMSSQRLVRSAAAVVVMPSLPPSFVTTPNTSIYTHHHTPSRITPKQYHTITHPILHHTTQHTFKHTRAFQLCPQQPFHKRPQRAF